jgi:TonB family protein
MDNVFTQLMDVFNWIIRSSAYAAAAVAVIALAQFALRRRLPARWIYALWLILLIRMVLPFGVESSLSLWNFLPGTIAENGFVSSHEVLTITSDGGGDASGDSPKSASPDFERRALSGLDTRAALALIWLAGTLVMIAVIAVNNFRLWRSVRKLRHATDQSILELFEDCKQSMRVRTVVGLAITCQVKSPSLFGCIRPRVLLPDGLTGQIPREELRFIFLHELAHLKQGDIWTGWIVAFLQSLHWFNPLVWWAFARMRADREVSCDALALSRARNVDNEIYGGALIGMLERFQHSRRLPVVAGILENKAQLKRRLVMITNFRHSTRGEIIAAAALFAVLSIALLTTPRTLISQSNEADFDLKAMTMAQQFASFGVAPDGRSTEFSILMVDGQAFTGITSETLRKSIPDGNISHVPALWLIHNLETTGNGVVGDSWVRQLTDGAKIEAMRERADMMKLNHEMQTSVDGEERAALIRQMAETGTEKARQRAEASAYPDAVRVGGAVMQSRLVYMVHPDYPNDARPERVSGQVALEIVIDEEGSVVEIQVISGHNSLQQAAIDAVKQWKYSPTLMNGNPIPVRAEVRITFNRF